ncbi:MAG TPA: class I SAM-dependent methyltransferase [Gemmatimonadales bacterium]|nr:class I SAM-dependent methyltransferase [Gemmatimonadales bacterium]
MAVKIAVSSPELQEFYSHRHNWRNPGEERMRFQKHMKLAQVPPGSAVLDIGSRNGDLRKYLPKDVKYQGLDIAPEFAAKDILIHDITSGLPFPDKSFDYVFMVEVLEHTPTAYSTAGEIHRVLKPGGVWMVSVPNPYHVKEILWNLFHVADQQGHIYSWTRQTISRLGEMNGFRLADWGGTYFYPPIPAPWLFARSVVYKFVKN